MVGDSAKASRTGFGCVGSSAAVSMVPTELEEIGSGVNQGAIGSPNKCGIYAIEPNLKLIEKAFRTIAAVQEQANSVSLESTSPISTAETGESRLEREYHRLKLSFDSGDETSSSVAYCPGLLASERVPVPPAQKSQCCEFNIL